MTGKQHSVTMKISRSGHPQALFCTCGWAKIINPGRDPEGRAQTAMTRHIGPTVKVANE